MDKDAIFLTLAQATDAICIDFQQYAPQTLLFSEVLRLVSTGSRHIRREPRKDGGWVNCQDGTNMKWLNGAELTEFMCRTIRRTQWQPELLAAVCGRVFQTRALPGQSPATGESGIFINTDMHGYACQQCGRCCRSLDYHGEITTADVAIWRDLQRTDILEWVKPEKTEGHKETYRVWVDPRTGWVATPSPFLKKNKGQNIWQCRIHDVKPGICRQYPISRKHALMTGCRGFEIDRPGNP